MDSMPGSMDVRDANEPTEFRVSTNGKVHSYVSSALEALQVRCLPSRLHFSSLHCAAIPLAAWAGHVPRARPSCE